ncbi:MAG TPA: ribonuclease E/G, partial [Tissierellales bacterium]|nr:ribonuclease E/G [Tissierellales bacterium]
RDSNLKNIDRIIVNSKEKYDYLKEIIEINFPQYIKKIVYEEFDIYKWGNIKREIEKILSGKIPLESGGYIVIDETEALTAIDVNTGKYTGKANLDDTILKTNLEAAREIGKQLRLQDLGGIIIIDFIDMRKNKDISLVFRELKKYTQEDSTKVNIVDMTKLGLVELTRKKVRNSLSSHFLQNCEHCHGKGKRISKKY